MEYGYIFQYISGASLALTTGIHIIYGCVQNMLGFTCQPMVQLSLGHVTSLYIQNGCRKPNFHNIPDFHPHNGYRWRGMMCVPTQSERKLCLLSAQWILSWSKHYRQSYESSPKWCPSRVPFIYHIGKTRQHHKPLFGEEKCSKIRLIFILTLQNFVFGHPLSVAGLSFHVAIVVSGFSLFVGLCAFADISCFSVVKNGPKITLIFIQRLRNFVYTRIWTSSLDSRR